ncbi:MAG: hypothetical protein ACOCQS_00650 [Bacillota bacterium]
MRRWLQKLGLLKYNYNNKLIPAGAGIILVLLSIAGWTLLLNLDIGNYSIIKSLIFLSIIIGLTGLIDDMAGDKKVQGLKGHFIYFLQGHLSTGSFKVIIVFISVLLVVLRESSGYEILLDLSLILLMTNMFNLFDLRPGRVIKLFLITSIFLFYIFDIFIYFIFIYIFLIPYLFLELKEKIMMGDAGSNFLGVITGYGFTKWNWIQGKIYLTGLLLVLTLLSERYSFSSYIKNNCILNWLDKLGRK